MIIQSIPNSSLNAINKKKINFCSENIKQNDISQSVNSNQNKENEKN